MEAMNEIFNQLRQQGLLETLLCYPANSTFADPYEKNKTNVYMPPLPVEGIVHSIGFSGLKWKYYAQLPTGSIQLIVEPKYKEIILSAKKIEYKNNYYTVYRDGTNFQYIERRHYIVFILGRKQSND